jgi:hypothetical protein
MKKLATALFPWLLCAVACGSPVSPPGPRPAETAPSEASISVSPGMTIPMKNNWDEARGNPGCSASGPEQTLRGVVRVAPFGKGTDGAKLDDGHQRWVLSYRAEGALKQLDGKRVEAKGRPCNKEGQAIMGPHFDLLSVTALE